MKRTTFLLATACTLFSLATTAQTNEDFNARPEAALTEVKGYLQDQCWYFNDFDINSANWNPGIEGDGAMVSAPGASTTASSGIYSPIVSVPGYITISFSYKFNKTLVSNQRRWIKIYLVNYENEIQSELDNLEFTSVSTTTTYTYNKSFSAGSGPYKVFISYTGEGGSTRVAIDQLHLSASRQYANGCNTPPVAVNDIVAGNANRTASGSICQNDYDVNGDLYDCYIVTNSPHGTVTLNYDKTFSFTPNPGFTGSSTSFTYQLCDYGYGPLCSNQATVTINFPTQGFLPVSLIDFSGIYRDNGLVELNWVSTFEQNSAQFIIERSYTGIEWETAGSVKAQGISTVRKAYRFTDEVGRNTANRKDIYYRLKMVDLDGKTAISRILVVRVYNTRSTKMISVSPNPAKNDIVANVQLNKASMVVVKVLNQQGAEVMRKSLKLQEGSNSIQMEGTSKLSPGMYVLEVIVNSNERLIVKLIKE